LLVCVGGGGLISGCAVAAHHLCPGIRVLGVEPEAGNDTQQSLARGEIVHIETPRTIADGAQTQHSGQLTFPVIQRHVSAILTVSDEQLVATPALLRERMKMVVEPTGCLARRRRCKAWMDLRGQRVGIILSGGNLSMLPWPATWPAESPQHTKDPSWPTTPKSLLPKPAKEPGQEDARTRRLAAGPRAGEQQRQRAAGWATPGVQDPGGLPARDGRRLRRRARRAAGRGDGHRPTR
jgi:hypothetical protein